MPSPIQPVRIAGVSPAGGAGGAGLLRSDESESAGFTRAITDALASVGQAEGAVTSAAEAAAVGDLESVSDFMIASAEAQLTTEITVAVRDRAISAFNDIMRMQI